MSKMIIYQLLVRTFGNANPNCRLNGDIYENGCGKFNDINDNALNAIHDLGATDLWLTGILQHATTTGYTAFGIPNDSPLIVKGRAGSPYAVKNYFDVDPDLAENVSNRMSEFEELVARIHRHDMDVIIDFVPNHLARQYYEEHFGTTDLKTVLFEKNNNFYYIQEPFKVPEGAYIRSGIGDKSGATGDYVEFPAKATGNDCFTATPGIDDWYDTIKLNYGIDFRNGEKHFSPRPRTWDKMYEALDFWAAKGVDGFRCDMSEMVPEEFWCWVIKKLRAKYKDIRFIAEIYNCSLYRAYLDAGFDYLYDKVGMYDAMRSIIEKRSGVGVITQAWQSTEGINDKMLRFLENHDEQRICSRHFAGDNAEAAIPSFAAEALMHGGPVLVYNGQEFREASNGEMGFSGDDGRSTIFDYWSFDKQRRWINGGLFNDTELSDKEVATRNKYREIIRVAKEEGDDSTGNFYDLMWVNERLYSQRCYAFIRGHLLYICNFDGADKVVKVNITQHILDYFGQKEKQERTIELHVPAYGWKREKIF